MTHIVTWLYNKNTLHILIKDNYVILKLSAYKTQINNNNNNNNNNNLYYANNWVLELTTR